MYRAEDHKAGKGMRYKKPYTSILPYLRDRNKEKTEAGKSASDKPVVKREKVNAIPVNEKQENETYDDARRSILAE